MTSELPTQAEVESLREDFESSLSALENAILELTYVGNRKQVNPEDLAKLLTLGKEGSKKLTFLNKQLSKALGTVVSNGAVVEAGTASLERKDSTPKKGWKHDQLKAVVAEAVIKRHTNEETGAIDSPVHALLTEAFGYAGISYWKKGALSEIGVDADRYCTRGESTASFHVVESRPDNETKDDDDDFL